MIRVRIPPSPTGLLHIGTARTALFNYLFARNQKGVMVFRSEDTDKERSKPEYEKNIIEGLTKLGIIGDEGLHLEDKNQGPHAPYRQSERTAAGIYTKYLEEILATDKAYYCFCSKERLDKMRAEQQALKLPTRYDGACSKLDSKASIERAKAEPAVIRIRTPHTEDLKFTDLVRGETVILAKELDDFVIARRLNDPLYNLTVVCDDHDMEITHVIRGEDHISNTPKQILIYKAFNWKIPEFAHLPLILNPDKTKLSKRSNKTSVDDYLAEGYLPEALINFLALLGWNPGEGSTQEIFTIEDLIQKFSLDHVHKGGAVFDLKKLDWINTEWIKNEIARDTDAFMKRAAPFLKELPDPALVKKLITDADFAGRFRVLKEIPEALSPFFTALPLYDAALILNEKFGLTKEIAGTVFESAKKALSALDWETGDTSKRQAINDALIALPTALNLKNGQVLWPIRVALSGLEKSPNFATLALYLGKEESLKRLDTALNLVK